MDSECSRCDPEAATQGSLGNDAIPQSLPDLRTWRSCGAKQGAPNLHFMKM